MRKALACIGLIALLAASAFAPRVALGSDLPRSERDGQSPGSLMGRIGLRFDPTSSMVQVIRPPRSRDLVDPSLVMASLSCPLCGTGCPPGPRTVVVVLQAIAPIALGYGVSDMASTNYTVTGVVQSTSAALAVGQEVTITITGNVISCGSNFTVWFSMCDVAPASYMEACNRRQTLLHEFAGGGTDGAYPYYQALAVSDSGTTLYGMTRNGGDGDPANPNRGVIFAINTDGSGFALLHEFAGGVNDGQEPYGGLIRSGTTLYGMTQLGGDSNLGTIFSIATGGDPITLLHEFAGGGDDGASPQGGLILVGSNLYGMTYNGGDSNLGVVFSISTDGSGFTLRHEFGGFPGGDGANPRGGLVVSGTTLYGMTAFGGVYNGGTIFSMPLPPSLPLVTLRHEFPGFPDDGNPTGDLVLSGTTLYGMTTTGGIYELGVLFSMATNGTGYALLHEFGDVGDGDSPYGSLFLSGSALYGMTASGGGGGAGVVFSLPQSGGTIRLLHEFAGGVADGGNPHGGVVVVGSTVYGMTFKGGDADKGVIFRLD